MYKRKEKFKATLTIEGTKCKKRRTEGFLHIIYEVVMSNQLVYVRQTWTYANENQNHFWQHFQARHFVIVHYTFSTDLIILKQIMVLNIVSKVPPWLFFDALNQAVQISN